jgi:hypothetical protein
MQVASGKKSRKEMEWQQRLARFAASGQPVKAFCEAEWVSEATFYRWRQRLGETGDAVAPATSFIDVGVLPLAAQSAPATHGEPADTALEIRLDLGHGLVLHIVRR